MLLIQMCDGASPADVETEVREGLAKLPELMEAANEGAARQGAQPGGGMNPAMMAQMLGGVAEKMDEALQFEQQEAALKISVKFPSGRPAPGENDHSDGGNLCHDEPAVRLGESFRSVAITGVQGGCEAQFELRTASWYSPLGRCSVRLPRAPDIGIMRAVKSLGGVFKTNARVR